MRFLQIDHVETADRLKIIENSSEESSMTRNRALAIRMSLERFKVKAIALICNITIGTVYIWFDKREQEGFDSLLAAPCQGRKTIIEPSEYDEVFEIVDQNPIQLKSALSEIQQKLGKTICLQTLKRIIHKKTWRRVRKSLKEKRNEEHFQKFKEEPRILGQDEKDGFLDLCCFDESGFSLVPEVPYAWQDKGTQICLPSSKSKRINVLGFMNKDSGLTPFVFESSVTSEVAAACFDSFAESITKQIIVIIDNASIHHSELFNSKIGDWEEKNLFLLYLPPYSPELNKIEILWKHIKYYRLSFDAYKNFDSLREKLNDVLCNVGRKYRINFV